jgi:lysyl-tRNA synthetase class 2
MMETTEKLLEKVALDVNGKSTIQFGEHTIDFKGPYKKISILESIRENTGYDLKDSSESETFEIAKKLGVEVDGTMGKGKLIDEIFGEKCESKYIQPTFIIDYPKEMSPLTKEHRSEPELTERFELLVNGSEIANAYSELNDPIDQLSRFEDQLKLSEKGDEEAMFIDYDFIKCLEYGMPPTSGIGFGIDRLVMLMTNKKSIQDVIFFPQMKPEKKLNIELNEEEKLVFSIIKKDGKIKLNDLKSRSKLSNKKWDKTIKLLTRNKLAKVEKNDDGLFISPLD